MLTVSVLEAEDSIQSTSGAGWREGRCLLCTDIYAGFWMKCSPAIWRDLVLERRVMWNYTASALLYLIFLIFVTEST